MLFISRNITIPNTAIIDTAAKIIKMAFTIFSLVNAFSRFSLEKAFARLSFMLILRMKVIFPFQLCKIICYLSKPSEVVISASVSSI